MAFDWEINDRIGTMKRLWDDGQTASMIASELGGGLSRNAVLAKMHRLGWAKRVKAASLEPRPRKSRALVPRPQPRPVAYARPAHVDEPEFDAEPAIETADLDIPIEQRCTLLELSSEKCHWPIGDPQQPDFYFCGAATSRPPYCQRHRSRAWDRQTRTISDQERERRRQLGRSNVARQRAAREAQP